jgi:hypothetical protein
MGRACDKDVRKKDSEECYDGKTGRSKTDR